MWSNSSNSISYKIILIELFLLTSLQDVEQQHKNQLDLLGLKNNELGKKKRRKRWVKKRKDLIDPQDDIDLESQREKEKPTSEESDEDEANEQDKDSDSDAEIVDPREGDELSHEQEEEVIITTEKQSKKQQNKKKITKDPEPTPKVKEKTVKKIPYPNRQHIDPNKDLYDFFLKL